MLKNLNWTNNNIFWLLKTTRSNKILQSEGVVELVPHERKELEDQVRILTPSLA